MRNADESGAGYRATLGEESAPARLETYCILAACGQTEPLVLDGNTVFVAEG